MFVLRCCQRARVAHLLSMWTPREASTRATSICHHATHTYSTQALYMPPRPEENVIYSPLPPLELPEQDAHNIIFSRALKWSNKDAIECGITGRKYTYGNIVDQALRWAGVVSRVLAAPSSKRNRLTLFSVNAPEFPILLLGSLAAGATVSTVSPSYTADEVARQLIDNETDMLVTDPKLESILIDALTKIKKTIPIFISGVSAHGHPNIRHILEDSSKPFAEPVQSPLKSTAVILYSSGTTGKPKGVELSHGAITSNLHMFTHPYFFPYLPTTQEYQESVIGVMPFYHVYGMHVVNLITLYLGAKVISLPAFTPQDFVRNIRDHKIRVLHTIPSILNFLCESPEVTSADLESVRVVLCAAAPVLPTTTEAFKKKAPNPILFQEGFGLTETLPSLITPMDDERIGWCGKCVPNTEIKIVDLETGKALPELQRGELCIRSPSLMTGYLNNPVATAETIDQDGFLHTGDVAVHKDGFVSIVDRIKELIKVKGYQVSPSELEDVLQQHPGVVDCAVVGVDDARSGEVPRAYIIRKDCNTTEEQVHEFMRHKVAKYKQLKGGIVFVDTLPRSSIGKILKKELKAIAP
nr:uncharacterized protein LOC128699358 [Cherax quadricarinatus]